MTYEEALGYIHSRIRIAPKGLDRMRLLMKKLGDPQKQLKFVHVAGSNGKGSTVAMCESVMRHAGYKTGMFVSPFVFDFRERIQINGQLVDKRLLGTELEGMLASLDEMKSLGMECTEFETVTALAIKIFAREKCDIVMFEVGIGGLFDCTNIIDPPEVAAIASISLEHTDMLGKTIPEIAAQKCGIIKKGSSVAAYCQLPLEALEVLSDRCKKLDIQPCIADMTQLKVLTMDSAGSDIEYSGKSYRVALAGQHQIYNALTVLCIIDRLRLRGYSISHQALREGLREVSFVGRLQIIRQKPLCIIDGAHNPEKIKSLCDSIDKLYAGRRLISIMGMLTTKDYKSCIPEIARRSDIFIAVTPNAPKALPAEETAQYAGELCKEVIICPDAAEAALKALALADDGSVVLACGSLYMIGETKTGFLGAK